MPHYNPQRAFKNSLGAFLDSTHSIPILFCQIQFHRVVSLWLASGQTPGSAPPIPLAQLKAGYSVHSLRRINRFIPIR